MIFGKSGAGFGHLGSIGKTSGGAAPAIPFWTLPTPPVSGLLFWSDRKTNSNFVFTDTTLGQNTYNAMEDMTGDGYGFFQPYRTLQPVVGSFSGPDFTGTQSLQCAAADMFAGLATVTLGLCFTLDSTFTPAANRSIFDNSSGSATQINIGVVGTGGNAGKLRINLRPNGAGTQYVSATTGSVVSNNTKHTLIAEINITSGSVRIDIYLDGSSYLSNQTFVPSTNIFTSITSGNAFLGNDSNGATPLGGEVHAALAYPTIDSTKRAAITTYLAGL